MAAFSCSVARRSAPVVAQPLRSEMVVAHAISDPP
jgi:hypothetical protein